MFKDLFSSKKFIAMLAGIIVVVLGNNGIVIPEAAVMDVLTPIVAYIVGQGIADNGKEREKLVQVATDNS